MNEQEFIRRIGEDLLRRCPDRYQIPLRASEGRDVFRLETEGYVRDHLQLQLQEYRLSPDGSLPGATVFRVATPVTVYRREGQGTVFPPLRCVITDPDLNRSGLRGSQRGRYRLTVLQIAGYQILADAGLITPEDLMIRHADGPRSEAERLAGRLAAYLLMPDPVLLAMTRYRNYMPFAPEEDPAMRQMAEDLQVPPRSLRLRLWEAGLLETRNADNFL